MQEIWSLCPQYQTYLVRDTVADVHWVIEQLIEACSRADNSDPK